MATITTASVRPPRLAEGVELIGEYEGSGFKEAPYLVRRADGQVVQISRLLFVVAEQVDGRRSPEEIAARATERFGHKRLSADNVEFLLDKKLRPLGIAALPDGTTPELPKKKKLLELQYRAAAVPDGAVRAIAAALGPLFIAPVAIAALVAAVAFDVWLFFVHGIGQGMRDALYQPEFMLLVLGLVVLSAAFHEAGHAAACRYGGATPGVMGAGLYIVWPVFYTDVTDCYRLGRWGRVRTDLGGVYFNVVFILGTAAAYFATGWEPLLLVIVVQHLEMLHQFLPFLRMDGYYVVADLTGVPDLFTRIKPILRSLLPWVEPDEKVTELKRWARIAVRAWVLTIVPILAIQLVLVTISAPRIYATAWDAASRQLASIRDAVTTGDVLAVVAGVLGLLAMLLPIAGLTMLFWKLGQKVVTSAWRWSGRSRATRTALVLVLGAFAASALYVWWPNGDYRPIHEGEKWTVQGGIAAVRDVPTGRPALTAEREAELGATTATSAPAETGTPESTTTTTVADEDEESTTTTEEDEPTSSSSTSSSTSTSTSTSTSSTTTTPTTTEP